MSTPILKLHGVGKQLAIRLARLNICTVEDLLFHFPTRYEDHTRLTPIEILQPEMTVLIEGEITEVHPMARGKTKLLCRLSDTTGHLHLRFFHVLNYQRQLLQAGVRARCYGEVRVGPSGLEMMHPELQILKPGENNPIDQHLTPIYPATDGVSQNKLRHLIQAAFTHLAAIWQKEIFPATLLPNASWPNLLAALQFIHQPPADTDLVALYHYQTPAQQRLIFEELISQRLSLMQLKKMIQSQASIPLMSADQLIQRFLAQLSFPLTPAQQRVMKEIQVDLNRAIPMLRLVQGDVGAGKTVIAALAACQAVAHRYQVAMMAPTELLAEQHHRVLHQWFAPLKIKVVLLTGRVKGKEREQALQMMQNGEAHIIVGTHALFQRDILFHDLALVIIDEQHRFGVEQRMLLRDKRQGSRHIPHQLMLTATPIPRTLAMSFYADLDCSILDELPPGRTPIQTSVLPDTRRAEVMERVDHACRQGRQVYWVCPLIEVSDRLDSKAVTEIVKELQAVLPKFRIGMIHGRLSESEKEAVMRAFKEGELQVLVATTVIEVGIDVPNASIIIIENSERLGLSQLHQLRGRVGRGDTRSYCILLYQSPLTPLAKQRLQVLRESSDGFVIAERDLTLRGPGEMYGTQQTGDWHFRLADLLRDQSLLVNVQQAADQLLIHYPDVVAMLLERWVGKIDCVAG